MLCNHRFGEQFLGYEPQSSRFGFGCKPSVEPQKWDKQHSRFTWFHLYHNVCHSFHICWVNIQIFGISVLWKAGTAGGEIGEKKKKKKKISPRLLVCLSDWQQQGRVWIWIKFHLSAFWATCFLANDLSPRCCNPLTMMLWSGASSIWQSAADGSWAWLGREMKGGAEKETHFFATLCW